MTLFISHPAASRKAIRYWQKKVQDKVRPRLMNPFYDFAKQREIIESDFSGCDIIETEKSQKNYSHLVLSDLKNLLSCTGVVAIFDGNYSVGVPMEVVYAKNAGLKVFSIVVNGRENNPFIKYFSDKVYLSFADFVEDFKIGKKI